MNPSFISFFAIVITLVSCGLPPIPETYQVAFPPLPIAHAELLGECQWKLEYYDSAGNFRQKEVTTASAEIGLLQEWPNAILAWPYWPEKSLAAGLFYPAGAIFPLDVTGETIILSWEAGAEAYFYRELDKAQELNTGTNRAPMYFDWKRFRSLLQENSNSELRLDPWLADWKYVAERTVSSGFRQSYIRAEVRTGVEISVPHDGPWLTASPFRQPLFWKEGENQILFLSPRSEIFVCPGGRLSISSQMLLWIPFP
ncbi:MAG: hypothetical protein FWG07_07410 [Treponema sp.]|nr:hypothetical protein [Treponema sp.]